MNGLPEDEKGIPIETSFQRNWNHQGCQNQVFPPRTEILEIPVILDI